LYFIKHPKSTPRDKKNKFSKGTLFTSILKVEENNVPSENRISASKQDFQGF
jgi:hypothetical protein